MKYKSLGSLYKLLEYCERKESLSVKSVVHDNRGEQTESVSFGGEFAGNSDWDTILNTEHRMACLVVVAPRMACHA